MFGNKNTGKKKKLLLLVAGLGLLSIISFAGIELTCTSWFCTRCHEMQRLGSSWELSKHGPDNPKIHNCMKCHAQEGFLGFIKAKINGLFSLVYHISGDYHLKATQPVVCIRSGCHQMEDMGKANRPTRTAKPNHEKHIKIMKKIGTRHQCMPCHRNIAHGEKTFLPDMKKDCFICHKENYQNICSSNCTSCHSDHLNFALQGEESRLFELHSDSQISCTECHPDAQSATGNCRGCHEGDDYDKLIVYEKEARL